MWLSLPSDPQRSPSEAFGLILHISSSLLLDPRFLGKLSVFIITLFLKNLERFLVLDLPLLQKSKRWVHDVFQLKIMNSKFQFPNIFPLRELYIPNPDLGPSVGFATNSSRDLKQVPICFGTSVSPPVKQWLFLTTPESQGPGTVRGPTKDPARLRMFTTSDPSTQASPAGPGSFHAGLAFLGSFSKQTLSPFLS